MNQELKEALAKYPDWIRKFEFDPVYGYLINPTYIPVSFDYEIIASILRELADLNKSG